MYVENAVMLADVLDDIFNNKVSANKHICVKHLFELVIAIHISLNFKHALFTIVEQPIIQIVIVYLFDILFIDLRGLHHFIIITCIFRCSVSLFVRLSLFSLFILDFGIFSLLLKISLDNHELLSLIMRDFRTAATYFGCLLHGASVEDLPIEDVKLKCLKFSVIREEGFFELFVVFACTLVNITLLRTFTVLFD